jgi:cytochrome c oxidase assembly protein subunit 11
MSADVVMTSQRNRRMMIGIMVLVFGMVGLAFASVPLYQLFCQVTGYGGTTQVSISGAGVFRWGANA